jgi:hypothetical protein
MAFYYGSGDSNNPKDEPPGGFRETIALIWVVFRVLALPVGALLGVVFAFVLLFWLFSVTPYLGLSAVALLVGALLARGIWEAKHPPEIR